MSIKTEKAVSKFLSGFNCAQAVLHTFCDEVHLETNAALKLACGFGAGMGRRGEICGAVSGGVLVIGARYGRDENSDATATETTYKKTNELLRRFEIEHGSVGCKEILKGCDLATPEGQQQFKVQEFKKNVCTPCVETVARILEEIL